MRLPLTVCLKRCLTSKNLWRVGMSHHLAEMTRAKRRCHRASGRWHLLSIAFSLLRPSAVEPPSAQRAGRPLPQGVECEMKPMYLPSIIRHPGSLSLQVRETETQRGKVTYPEPHRVRIQVLGFSDLCSSHQLVPPSPCGFNNLVSTPLGTVKIRLDGERGTLTSQVAWCVCVVCGVCMCVHTD